MDIVKIFYTTPRRCISTAVHKIVHWYGFSAKILPQIKAIFKFLNYFDGSIQNFEIWPSRSKFNSYIRIGNLIPSKFCVICAPNLRFIEVSGICHKNQTIMAKYFFCHSSLLTRRTSDSLGTVISSWVERLLKFWQTSMVEISHREFWLRLWLTKRIPDSPSCYITQFYKLISGQPLWWKYRIRSPDENVPLWLLTAKFKQYDRLIIAVTSWHASSATACQFGHENQIIVAKSTAICPYCNKNVATMLSTHQTIRIFLGVACDCFAVDISKYSHNLFRCGRWQQNLNQVCHTMLHFFCHSSLLSRRTSDSLGTVMSSWVEWLLKFWETSMVEISHREFWLRLWLTKRIPDSPYCYITPFDKLISGKPLWWKYRIRSPDVIHRC